MNRLLERAQIGVLSTLLASMLGHGACGGGSGAGDASDGRAPACQTGDEGCACWPNKTCNSASLSCYSMLCVATGSSGNGGVVSSGGVTGSGGVVGLGGTPGNGGATVASGTGGASVVPGTGGATIRPGTGGATITPGTGGATFVPGTGGTSVVPGTGGATITPGTGGAIITPGTGGTPGAGGTSGGGGSGADTCNNAAASVIDNFATCDSSICNLAGRNGEWFSYSSNTNIGIQCSAQVPPVSWIDRGCGYYCTNGVAGATWAGAGFNLKDPSGTHDLSSYTGVYVRIETGQLLTVAMTDLAGSTWRSASIGGGSGAVTYTIPFSKLSADSGSSGSLNLSQIVGFRFDVDSKSLSSFGLVIHTVTLY